MEGCDFEQQQCRTHQEQHKRQLRSLELVQASISMRQTAGGAGVVYEGVNLDLNDSQGGTRMRLLVDETGAPSIECYDADAT